MKIEPTTTLSELQIGLAKLGAVSMTWTYDADGHIVTLVAPDKRFVGYGLVMTGALGDALNKLVMHVGADAAISFHGSKSVCMCGARKEFDEVHYDFCPKVGE
jgi:hypothetical protein